MAQLEISVGTFSSALCTKPAWEAAAEKIQAIYRGRMVREQQAPFWRGFHGFGARIDPC